MVALFQMRGMRIIYARIVKQIHESANNKIS